VTSRDSPAPTRRAVLSRRSALRAGVAAGLGLTLPSPAGAADPSATESPGTEPPGTDRAAVGATTPTELTVATYNLGLGANLFSLFLVSSADELARTVGDLYADIERSAPAARMAAVAAELARTRPDVVGVQEAALVRTGPPGDGGAASEPDADAVAFDFLASLTDALDDAGASYEVAQVTTNADAAFPGVVDGDRTDVRLTDRDAVLVRADADVEVTAASATAFDETTTVPAGDRTLDVERGYGVVAATAGDAAFTVVNTHLESASESVRGAQADELAAVLAALDGPTVLLGDLNDGPAFGGGAYETLAADLTDAWVTARPDADGFTCCRATTLDGPGSIDERLDHGGRGDGGRRPSDRDRHGRRDDGDGGDDDGTRRDDDRSGVGVERDDERHRNRVWRGRVGERDGGRRERVGGCGRRERYRPGGDGERVGAHLPRRVDSDGRPGVRPPRGRRRRPRRRRRTPPAARLSADPRRFCPSAENADRAEVLARIPAADARGDVGRLPRGPAGPLAGRPVARPRRRVRHRRTVGGTGRGVAR
jgi:hypothetical protein